MVLKGKPTKVNFCYLPQLGVDNQKIAGNNFMYLFRRKNIYSKGLWSWKGQSN